MIILYNFYPGFCFFAGLRCSLAGKDMKRSKLCFAVMGGGGGGGGGGTSGFVPNRISAKLCNFSSRGGGAAGLPSRSFSGNERNRAKLLSTGAEESFFFLGLLTAMASGSDSTISTSPKSSSVSARALFAVAFLGGEGAGRCVALSSAAFVGL